MTERRIAKNGINAPIKNKEVWFWRKLLSIVIKPQKQVLIVELFWFVLSSDGERFFNNNGECLLTSPNQFIDPVIITITELMINIWNICIGP